MDIPFLYRCAALSTDMKGYPNQKKARYLALAVAWLLPNTCAKKPLATLRKKVTDTYPGKDDSPSGGEGAKGHCAICDHSLPGS